MFEAGQVVVITGSGRMERVGRIVRVTRRYIRLEDGSYWTPVVGNWIKGGDYLKYDTIRSITEAEMKDIEYRRLCSILHRYNWRNLTTRQLEAVLRAILSIEKNEEL